MMNDSHDDDDGDDDEEEEDDDDDDDDDLALVIVDGDVVAFCLASLRAPTSVVTFLHLVVG